MIRNIYSVYDSIAQMYNTPMLCINDQDALRLANTIAQTEGTPIHDNPQDYTLFKLGSFDDSCALYELLETPERIISFHEILKKTSNQVQNQIADLEETLVIVLDKLSKLAEEKEEK